MRPHQEVDAEHGEQHRRVKAPQEQHDHALTGRKLAGEARQKRDLNAAAARGQGHEQPRL